MSETHVLTIHEAPGTAEAVVEGGTYRLDVRVPDSECEVYLQRQVAKSEFRTIPYWYNVGSLRADETQQGARSATLGPFQISKGSRIRLGYPFAKYPEGVAATLTRIE